MVTKELLKVWMHENKGAILYDELHYGVFTGYVTFTPARAKIALENNIRNRKVNDTQINVVKEAMSNNLWDDNVSKINFASSGELSDGQHRLIACVRSGITFRCMVTWGVTRTAQLATDRRGARSLSDDLEIAGYKNTVNLAAVARVVYQFQRGSSVSQIIAKSTSVTSNASDQMIFNFFLNRQDEIIEKERVVSRVYTSLRDLHISKTVLNPLVIEFDRISKEDAEAFWKQLSSGFARFENDPIFILRKRFIDDAKSNTSNLPAIVKTALIIKAWNMYMTGTTVKQLKWTSGGANPEKFPEIYNPNTEEEVSLA